MTQQAPKPSFKSVQLYEEEGETLRYIQAEIGSDGNLVLSGQDVGRAPKEFWGDSDYEYWVTVSCDDKDAVLLALLKRLFGGNRGVFEEFRDLLKAHGIQSEFFSYV